MSFVPIVVVWLYDCTLTLCFSSNLCQRFSRLHISSCVCIVRLSGHCSLTAWFVCAQHLQLNLLKTASCLSWNQLWSSPRISISIHLDWFHPTMETNTPTLMRNLVVARRGLRGVVGRGQLTWASWVHTPWATNLSTASYMGALFLTRNYNQKVKTKLLTYSTKPPNLMRPKFFIQLPVLLLALYDKATYLNFILYFILQPSTTKGKCFFQLEKIPTAKNDFCTKILLYSILLQGKE